jgi:biopolymer transport protein ExbD
MKIKRSRKPKKGRIEIIPMIDVMFFLLATFMLASLSMQKINALPVNLPQGQAEQSDISKKITITINQNNQIFVNQEAVGLEALNNKLQGLLNAGGDDTIIIAADKNSSHGTVTEAMLKAKEAGAKHFSIVAKN